MRLLSSIPVRQTRPLTTSPLASILQHTEYSEMKALLQAQAALGPLDSASLHILHQDIQVNQRVLNLNSFGLNSWVAMLNSAMVKAMREEGMLKLGSPTWELCLATWQLYSKEGMLRMDSQTWETCLG